MTIWERHFNSERARELTFWTIGYAIMGLGCALLLGRPTLPMVVSQGVTNILIVSGYLLLLAGAMPFVVCACADRAGHILCRRRDLALRRAALSYATWSAVGSFFIAIPCFTLALMLVLNGTTGTTRSWVLASVVFGLHGMVYLARVVVIPSPIR